MTSNPKYEIVYDAEFIRSMRTIDKKYRSMIRRTIQAQLQFEPEVETRNRKPIQEPNYFDAQWELRLGPNNRFRVLYRVENDVCEVCAVAVGVKIRNQVYIGGEATTL
ncbi:MAG: addiction module toxin RelE [Chloroflexota bacterium]